MFRIKWNEFVHIRLQGVTALRRFEKQAVDDRVVFEESKVQLYVPLILVGKQELSGILCPRVIPQRVADEQKAAGLLPGSSYGSLIAFDLKDKTVCCIYNFADPVGLGHSFGVSDLWTDFGNESMELALGQTRNGSLDIGKASIADLLLYRLDIGQLSEAIFYRFVELRGFSSGHGHRNARPRLDRHVPTTSICLRSGRRSLLKPFLIAEGCSWLGSPYRS